MNDKLQIRPRSITEIIDSVFSVYMANFVPLLLIVGVVTVPIVLLQGLVNLAIVDNIETVDLNDVSSLTDLFPVGTISSSFVLGLLSWLATTLAAGGVVKAVADAYLGRPVDWQDSLRYAFSRFGPLLLGSLLFGIGVSLGIIFFVIPGIILAVSWAVFAPAVLIERMSGGESLGRSWSLMAGRRGPVFGLFIVIFVLIAIIGGILSAVFTSADYTFLDVIIDALVQALLAPLMGISVVTVYFDLRARKTGYDNAALAQDIDFVPPPPPLIR